MKIYFLLVVLLISSLFSSSFASPIESLPLSQKITTLFNDFEKNLNIGVVVQDAKTGEVLYKRNANRYFMPASNEKLFTAFVALHHLGTDFTYQTRLFIDKTKNKNGALNDNIYLQFTGDPTLTIEQLDSLIASLSQVGIQNITGKIVVDDATFDKVTSSPGTAWDDQDFCWGSPVSALIINHNCASAKIVPSKINQPTRLELPIYPQSMHFINQVMTRSPKTNCLVKIQRTDDKTYKISGCIRTTDAAKTIEVAIRDPHHNTQLILAYLFKKNHINISQKFEFRKFVNANPPYASHDSLPLLALVSTMLKDSDNTIADSLFKTTGSAYTHEAGSFINGNKAAREILAAIQLNVPKTILIDGSGISRYNFLTPQQIVTLLQKIHSSPPIAAAFLTALPIAGTDGTLKDRMKDPTMLGKIYAKTGSETAVSSLSGYLETKTKRTLIFSIMINGFVDSPSKYKVLEDKFCQLLVEFL